jgi:hypothetical protein
MRNKLHKIKIVTYCLLAAMLSVCFSACDFFSYENGEDEETTNYINQLKKDREEYVSALNSLSNEDEYYATEQREYKLLLIEAINELNECKKVDELATIYDKNALLINSIKKIADYEAEEQLKQAELAQAKEDYIDKLTTVSSENVYRDNEKVVYNFYLNSGIEEINTCEDINYLDKIYETYKDVIESVKTNAQYEVEEEIAFDAYKQNKILEIENYVNIADYRNDEADTILVYIEKYKDDILNASDETATDNYVRDFKIKIYSVKTNAQLYKEELNNQKNEAIQYFDDNVNIDKYRQNEAIIVQTLIASFNAQLDSCETKESVASLLNTYKGNINSIKTDAILYEEERVVLVEECYNELLSYIDLDNFDEDFASEYLSYCEGIRSEMYALSTKEEVNAKLLSERKSAYLLGAQQNEITALRNYQSIIAEELTYYLDSSLYRQDQKSEIILICNNCATDFNSINTYDATMERYDSALNSLDEVLTNDELWNLEDEEFRKKLKDLYGDYVLDEPKSLTEASSYDELAEIIDYYAFYQLDGSSFVRDTFRVKLNWSHKDATWERNEVYWYCELLKSAVDIKAEFEDNSDYLVITLIAYNFATESNASKTTRVTRYDSLIEYDSDKTNFIDRDEDFDDFAYYQFSKTATVWNSQQLWYALEQGYIPNCVPGSTAEDILNKTKAILREIIKEGMSDEEKIFTIYNWFGKNVQYDPLYLDYNYSSDSTNLPNEIISACNSLFIEGTIYDRLAVCIGYSKTYLLMLRIEGIESRIEISKYGRSGNYIDSIATNFHSYVFIKLNNCWYYSDASFSSAGQNKEYVSIAYMYLPKYKSSWMTEMTNVNLEGGIDIDMLKHLSYNGIKIFVNNIEELCNLLNNFEQDTGNGCLTVIFTDEYSSCYNDLISNYNNYSVYKTTISSLFYELIIYKV